MVVLHRDAQVLAGILSPEEEPRAQLRIRHSKLQFLMGIGTLVISRNAGMGWFGAVVWSPAGSLNRPRPPWTSNVRSK